MSDPRRFRADARRNHRSETPRDERGPVRNYSQEEIAQMKNDPTSPVITPPAPPARNGSEQIAAMLRLTDRQLRNLEKSQLLNDAQVLELSKLATIVRACLVRSKDDDGNNSGPAVDLDA